VNRLGETFDSFGQVLDQVSFIVQVCGWIWVGLGIWVWIQVGIQVRVRVRVRGLVRVTIIGIFLRFLGHIFNMATGGPLHEVKSIVMGCYTNAKMGGW